MQERLAAREIVLLGVGHTNAHVLRMWRMDPVPDARLTCISDCATATYSGMLPGTLAGRYRPEQMEIDLVRLCSSAGVRLVVDRVSGLDRERRELKFVDRTAIPFDVLSIGIGSVPRGLELVAGHPAVVPIKPMQTFLARLGRRLDTIAAESHSGELQVAVVGGGVGGMEIALALDARLRREYPAFKWAIAVVDRRNSFGPFPSEKANRIANSELASRGIRLCLGREVIGGGDKSLTFADGSSFPCDVVLWATDAAPPPALHTLGLPTDERGFILVQPTLECMATATEGIFAVGDTGTIGEFPTPKSGVYAVRQGPVLWENIRRKLRGKPLVRYRPQRRFLKLAATGDGRAILDYGAWGTIGRWCFALKDRIDRRFMSMYQDYRPMPVNVADATNDADAMRCLGCGGKVPSRVLSEVFARLDLPASEDVVTGLSPPGDAAVVRAGKTTTLAVTTDFFAAPLADAYLVGRIAALNALGDAFAVGARPRFALGMVTIPPGPEKRQAQLLWELLAGGMEEFSKAGVVLVGGHTLEGPRTVIGFTILGDFQRTARGKAGLSAGDQLFLTKPLGTGVLLAAHMRARCCGEWFETLVAGMLNSNQGVADVLCEFDIRATTDVTGFGLAGHLWEMLSQSGVSARIDLNCIPLLPGTSELLSAGIESTLAPANRSVETHISLAAHASSLAGDPRYAALFDPQTSGGLLFGVSPQAATELRERLKTQHGVVACRIGEVLAEVGEPRIVVSSGEQQLGRGP
jgi:selenide,water dikinase